MPRQGQKTQRTYRSGERAIEFHHEGKVDEHESNNDVRLATEGGNGGELILDFEQQQQQQQIPLPPSSASVLGAALDASTITTIFLIFFMISSAEGGRYIDHRSSNDNNDYDGSSDNSNPQQAWMKYVANIAAPLFPLGLFLIAAVALVIPYQKRKVRFYSKNNVVQGLAIIYGS